MNQTGFDPYKTISKSSKVKFKKNKTQNQPTTQKTHLRVKIGK